jgi:hypothetical protein
MESAQKIIGSYVEWSAVIAGTALACALSLILLQFGGTLGLSIDNNRFFTGDHVAWRVILVGLWILWTQIIAAMSGGYIAGRLRAPIAGSREHESEVRDGMHGLLVWATSTLVTAAVAAISAYLTAIAALQGVDTPGPVKLPEDMARTTSIIFGFTMIASSLVSAVGAWWTATIGGDHRDTGFDLSRYISFHSAKKRR